MRFMPVTAEKPLSWRASCRSCEPLRRLLPYGPYVLSPLRAVQRNGCAALGAAVLLCRLLFGDLPVVQENLKLLIVGIILVSILPGVIEVWRHRRQAKQQKQP